eukprot:1332807-Amorphochlora_amoeboformis.AAC.2
MPKRARPLVIVPVRTQVNYGVPADRLAGAKSHGEWEGAGSRHDDREVGIRMTGGTVAGQL